MALAESHLGQKDLASLRVRIIHHAALAVPHHFTRYCTVTAPVFPA
jgi:hypothetical protein